MRSSGPAVCLDLSRLVARVGRGPWTGIDRVEAAWLDRLKRGDLPAFGLVRMRLGHALLDQAGLAELAARLRGEVPWGPADFAARLTPRLGPEARRVEADLRRLSLATCARPRLGAMLSRHLPRPVTYLNLGHANLTERALGAVAGLEGARIAVLVHDVIPLTHPDCQRPGMPAAFEARMRRVAARADLTIHPSDASRAEAAARFAGWGRVPPALTARLGVTPPAGEAGELPSDLMGPEPWFVCLGTIEPRKNHAVLLDVWDRLDPERAPRLLILGARGWANEAVFCRLDTARPPVVIERAGLSDAQVAALLRGARGLLFPSLAEGYGFPALEAAALGVPVVCSDLPVFRELLGDYPVYADPGDSYVWQKAIMDLAGQTEAGARSGAETAAERAARALAVPAWEDHFNLVLSNL